jgi:hypothetical protein
MDPQIALQHRTRVEEFRCKHRTELVTLLFTDIVGSTALDSSAWCSGELRQAWRHAPLIAPVCPRRFEATAGPRRFHPSPSLVESDADFGSRSAGSRSGQQTYLGQVPAGFTLNSPFRSGMLPPREKQIPQSVYGRTATD